jgi:cation transport ATPase
LEEEFGDTKGVIKIRKSKKDRQHNGKKKKDRQHNGQKKKDRQHNGQKKKDRRVVCPSVHFTLVFVLLVHLSLIFGHFVSCPSVSVLLAIVFLVLLSLFLVIAQWSKETDRRTGNTMTKRK